jgi:hypothetical protein
MLFALIPSLFLVLTAVSCQLATGGTSSGGLANLTLAETIVNDYITQVQGASFSRATLVSNKLAAADVASLKATILTKVSNDGLSSSTKIEEILPSVMAGISAGVQNLTSVSNDTSVAATLLQTAIKSTVETLNKNTDKISATSLTVTDVIQTVVKAGASDLADLAVKDPVNAEAALKKVVSDVSAAGSTLTDKNSYLQAVVTATVQVSVKKGQTGLAEAAFAGAAVATTDTTVIQGVVEQAVKKSQDDVQGAILDTTKATDLLKKAAAGLGNQTIVANAGATLASTVTLSQTDIDSIKAVAAESLPTASLTATFAAGSGAAAAVPSTEVDYVTGGYTLTLATVATGGTAVLTGPTGAALTLDSQGKATFTTTGAGAYRFVLTVTSASGEKKARAVVLFVVKAKADEVAPTAVLTVKEGTQDATAAPLTWTKAGHTLTLSSSGSAAGTGSTGITTLLITNNPDLDVVDNGDGTWTTTLRKGTVEFDLYVKNADGSKATKVVKTVTVADEPTPLAKLVAKYQDAVVTGPLTGAASYDIVLDASGSTANGTTITLTSSPFVTLVNGTAANQWVAKGVTATTVFTLNVLNDGGVKFAQAKQTISLATEVAPVAKLSVTEGGNPVTGALAAGPHNLTFSPAGSTLTNTDLVLTQDAGDATVVGLTKNQDATTGAVTWTATGVQATSNFTLTVSNKGGKLSTTAKVTVTISAATGTNVDVSSDVKAGQEALLKQQWTTAKTSFTSALVKNPNDTDAKIWSAVVDLASLTVNPQLVDLLQNRIGLIDYPSDMETLLNKGWLTASAYNYHTGFIMETAYNANSNYYVRGKVTPATPNSYMWVDACDAKGNWVYPTGTFTPDPQGDLYAYNWTVASTASAGYTYTYASDYAKTHAGDGTVYYRNYNFLNADSISPLPRLAPVTGFQRVEYLDAGTAPSSTDFGPVDYARLLVANLIARNPLGANAIVDQVLNGPLGASFDTILKRIDSLSATDRTEIPATYITLASGGVSAVTHAQLPSFTVSIGKPELLLLTAQLRSIKSFVQYLGSVDLNYPLGQAFVNSINTARSVDANNNGVDDATEAIYATTPGLYHTTLFTTRNAALRTASRDTFAAALTDVSTSMDLYASAFGDPNSNYAAYLALYAPENPNASVTASKILSVVTPVVQNLKAQADLVKAAVVNNTPLNLSDEVLHPTYNSSNPMGIVDLLAGNVDTTKYHTALPGAIWANNVMDLRFWFQSNATTGFQLYVQRSGSSSSSTSSGAYFSENDFAFLLPADRSQMTAKAYNLAATPTGNNTYRYLYAGLAFALNLNALQTFYPEATLTDSRGLGLVPFGPGWNVVRSNWVDGYQSGTSYVSGHYDYQYQLTPPAYAESFLSWINK